MKLSAREYDGGTYHIYEGDSESLVALLVGDHCVDEKLAQLMASAPELLEALELVLKANEPFAMTVYEKEFVWRNAQAAIAKAKGEQQ